MKHLYLKRFPDDCPSFTSGAKRDRAKHPHLVVVEPEPSGRAKCKLCDEKIAKFELRFVIFLKCHKGYRIACTLHKSCFWEHPERRKLTSLKEIRFSPVLSKDTASEIVKTTFILQTSKSEVG
jgi:hypothetical protein